MLKGLLAWSNLRDSGNRRVSDYTLDFKYGILDWDGKLLGIFAAFFWTGFMLMGTVAATLMSWVSDPEWLNGITSTYEDLTKSLFSVVNPIYIAVMTFVILMVMILAGKAKSTSSKLTKEDINRITAGMGIMLVVCILVANPFAILRTALSLAQAAVDVVAGDNAPSAINVDALLRQPTLLVTYGKGITDTCADVWSRGGNASACAGTAASPSEVTVIIAALAALLAGSALMFALVAMWKFIVHLSVSIIAVIVIPWVAASTITKRRQFDGFARHGIAIGSHMLMAMIVQVISIAGPTLMASLLGSWGTNDWAVLQMLLLTVSWVFLTGFLFFVTRRKGGLSRVLKTDAHNTLSSMFGGSSAVNNALNKFDVQGRTVSGVKEKLSKGKAANVVTNIHGAFRNGKLVQDDVTDAQRVVSMPTKVTEFRVTNGVVDRRNASPAVPAAGTPATPPAPQVGKLRALARAGTRAVKYLTTERVIAQAQEAEVERLKALGEPLALPQRTAVPINFTNDDMRELSQEVMTAQRDAESPEFGGRSPRTSVEDAILAEVERAIADAKQVGQVPHVALERLDASGAVVEKLSVADLHRAMRESRSRRGSAEASVLGGGGVRDDDDDVIRMTVNYSAKQGTDRSIARRVWGEVRKRASNSARNALRGSPVTRGDVHDTWSTGDSARAYEEVDRYHAVQKMRAMGGNPHARLDTDDVNDVLAVRATPNSPYGPVSPRFGLGCGDRID